MVQRYLPITDVSVPGGELRRVGFIENT